MRIHLVVGSGVGVVVYLFASASRFLKQYPGTESRPYRWAGVDVTPRRKGHITPVIIDRVKGASIAFNTLKWGAPGGKGLL